MAVSYLNTITIAPYHCLLGTLGYVTLFTLGEKGINEFLQKIPKNNYPPGLYYTTDCLP